MTDVGDKQFLSAALEKPWKLFEWASVVKSTDWVLG